MIPLAAIGAGMSLLGGIGKTGLGLSQMFRANRIKAKRPTYDIPTEYSDMLGQRQNLLNSRSRATQQYEQNVGTNQANTINQARNQATSGASLLGAASMAQANANLGYQKVAGMDENYFFNNLAGLENAQQVMGQQKEKQFQINEMMPYQEAMQTKSAMMGGGLQNLFGGINSIGGTIGGAYGLMQSDPQFNAYIQKIMGGKGVSRPPVMQ